MDLFQVVDHAEHQPLAVHLGFSSKGEAVQANGTADIGKDMSGVRLDYWVLSSGKTPICQA